jgi:gliding motility associated protien GldN
MNWRNFLLVALISFGANTFAQSNLLNAKSPEQIGIKTEAEQAAQNDKPMPYGYVGDRDILMGKTVWEQIDLNQRVNFPLYFPVDDGTDLGADRKPLFQVLMDGIRDKKITKVYDSGYFTTLKSYDDILKTMSVVDTLPDGKAEVNNDPEAYKTTKKMVNKGTKKNPNMVEEIVPPTKFISQEFITKSELKPVHVSGYRVKGFWYFDKRQGEMKYRLLGLCPITPDVYTMNSDTPEYNDMFWIFFPDARDVLHQSKAFNEKNSAMPYTFDHLLNARRFSGVVYLEENVYGDREIKDYMKENAQMQLLESERVKEKIRNFELDMWNY